MSLRLNLGSNDDRREGWASVDISPPADVVCDLREPWPWEDSSVDEILAHDVFEHLPQVYQRLVCSGMSSPDGCGWIPIDPKLVFVNGIIHALNESHRVLKPGGILDLVVPCYPGIAPICDPTHGSFWCADLRYYFDERWSDPKTGERGRLGPAYGITALFRTLPESRSGVDWNPIQYAADAPDRRKLFLKLSAVK